MYIVAISALLTMLYRWSKFKPDRYDQGLHDQPITFGDEFDTNVTLERFGMPTVLLNFHKPRVGKPRCLNVVLVDDEF